MKKITEEMTVAAQAIYDRDGSLKSTVILDAARDESSPLHGYFEWDDTKAAEKYRRIQARWFCSNITLVDKRCTEHHGPEPLIHVPSTSRGPGKYKTVHAVVRVQSELERAIDEIIADISPLQHKLDTLGKLSPCHIGTALEARYGLMMTLRAIRKIRANPEIN